jgi:Prp8 binding protein
LCGTPLCTNTGSAPTQALHQHAACSAPQLRIWDMRPFAPTNRCVKVLSSHMHSFEKTLLRCDWSPDGEQVAAGSADRMVYIWEVASRRLLYKLPGHLGSVNDVAFHPKEPIVMSASSDKALYLGELVA